MLPERESRPAANRAAYISATDIDLDTVIINPRADESAEPCRCDKCRRPLRAALSVRLGVGPVCRRLLAEVAA